MLFHGFAPVDRRILSWCWIQDSSVFRVFMVLLFGANYAESRFANVTVRPGQCVVTMTSIANILGVSRGAVRRAFEMLCMSGDITVERFPRFYLVTVNSFNQYQLDMNGNNSAKEKNIGCLSGSTADAGYSEFDEIEEDSDYSALNDRADDDCSSLGEIEEDDDFSAFDDTEDTDFYSPVDTENSGHSSLDGTAEPGFSPSDGTAAVLSVRQTDGIQTANRRQNDSKRTANRRQNDGKRTHINNINKNKKESKIIKKSERGALSPHGTFGNVFLSSGELSALKERYPDSYLQKIERLSLYMRSSGNSFADHYATLLCWLGEDEGGQPEQDCTMGYNSSFDIAELDRFDTLDFLNPPSS